MSCIVYDKEGKQHKVKAVFVTHMLERGYTSSPPKNKPTPKADLADDVQNELTLDVEETKVTTKKTTKAKV